MTTNHPSVKRRKNTAAPSVPTTSTLVIDPLVQRKKGSNGPAAAAVNGDILETQTTMLDTPKKIKKKKSKKIEDETTAGAEPTETPEQPTTGSLTKPTVNHKKEKKKRNKESAKSTAVESGEKELETIQKFRSGLNELKGRWRVSSTLGGTFSELPPVFSQDEKYLLIARENTILVYSTKTSLLLRTLALPVTSKSSLVFFALNPQNPSEIVATMQNGKVYLIDWAEDDLVREWTVDSNEIDHATLAPADEELETDAVATIYITYGSALARVSLLKKPTTYDSDSGIESDADLLTTVIREFPDKLAGIRVVEKGQIIAVVTINQVHLGWRRDDKITALSKKSEKYAKWIQFTIPTSKISCFTVAATYQQVDKKQPPKLTGSVAVGGGDGAIYLWSNVLAKYEDAVEAASKPPQKLHWHRRRVRALTTSQDGNYIISGGEESVLVMWQLETSSKSFLPYLSGSIEDVIVSPQGTNYGIRLSDNSVMVLSITELKPKASIVGLQTKGYSEKSSSVPFVIHPTQANKLLLVAPTSEDAVISENTKVAPAPFLQTYDTFSDRAVGRQALARNNVTVKAFGPGDIKLLEPDIKHLAISADGNWLASVDTWTPPARDLQSQAVEEIYLKFWKWSEERKQWELVARIDGPHPSEEDVAPERVVDMIPLPKSTGFITLGSDGTARIWKPRSRVRGGVTVRQTDKDKKQGVAMETWGCRRIIRVSLPQTDLKAEGKRTFGTLAISKDESLLAIAYPELSTLRDEVQKDSAVFLCDPHSGKIAMKLDGLKTGHIKGMVISEKFLVAVGTYAVAAWNLVAGRIEWYHTLEHFGITQSELIYDGAFIAAQGKYIGLAFNYSDVSATAVTAPKTPKTPKTSGGDHSKAVARIVGKSKKQLSITKPKEPASRVLIFDMDHAIPSPILVQSHDFWISNFKADTGVGGGKGFIILDALRHVRFLTPVNTPRMIAPSQDDAQAAKLELGIDEDDDTGALSAVYGGLMADETEKKDEDVMDIDEDAELDAFDESKVLPHEKIREVFEVDGADVEGLAATFGRLVSVLGRRPLDDDEDVNKLRVEDGNEVDMEDESDDSSDGESD